MFYNLYEFLLDASSICVRCITSSFGTGQQFPAGFGYHQIDGEICSRSLRNWLQTYPTLQWFGSIFHSKIATCNIYWGNLFTLPNFKTHLNESYLVCYISHVMYIYIYIYVCMYIYIYTYYTHIRPILLGELWTLENLAGRAPKSTKTRMISHNYWSYMDIYIYTSWWFGTFFIFPYIGNNHPN